MNPFLVFIEFWQAFFRAPIKYEDDPKAQAEILPFVNKNPIKPATKVINR